MTIKILKRTLQLTFYWYIIQERDKTRLAKKNRVVLACLKRGFLPWLKNKEIKKAANSDRKQRIKKAVNPYREWDAKKADARMVQTTSHFSERCK